MQPIQKKHRTVLCLQNQGLNDGPLWNFDGSDKSMLFSPANFEPEKLVDRNSTDFYTQKSSSTTNGSCVSSKFGRAAVNCWDNVEPSREPCIGDIPLSDLVFWLGNTSTGEVVCSCAQCGRRVMRSYTGNVLRQQRYSPYQQQRQQVSSRVPVLNLPRVEGVN